MADPWELVLHHSYTGMPGVIFDQSPGRGGHGAGRNLTPADYLDDGIAPGSGAIRFNGSAGVDVRLAENSQLVGGVRVDMVCASALVRQQGTLIDSSTVNLEVSGDQIFQGWVQTESGSQGFGDGTPPHPVPVGDWVTVSFVYDGLTFLDVSINGTLVLTFTDPGNYWPLLPTDRLSIGNRLNNTDGVRGAIDDVKIWRLDPRRVDKTFRRRPLTPAVDDCWAKWGKELRKVLDSDPECALQIRDLLLRALRSVQRSVPGWDASARWDDTAEQYGSHWVAGELDAIPALVVDQMNWLRDQNADPFHNPDVQALLNSPCFRKLADKIPPLTCDQDFTDMLAAIGRGLSA